MTDLVILGTDTGVGKTTFALLWLTAFADRYEYWKPIETGASDSQRVKELVPGAAVHLPIKHFPHPLAPPLAARMEKDEVPLAASIAAATPWPRYPERGLLIETFGSPFSPLNEQELQTELIRAWQLPCILISSSTVGAIGRTLQCLEAVRPLARIAAVVLVGPPDPFALQRLAQETTRPIFSLRPPGVFDLPGLIQAAQEQREVFEAVSASVRDDSVWSPEKVDDLLARDRHHVWHPYTSLGDPDPPLPVVAAQDEFLYLADGRRVIDGISSWWTILHGHRHPPLLAALHEATQALDHVHFAGVTHAPAVELAEMLLSTAPWSGGRVFYSDNGSTAVEVALKMAYQYWCHQGQPQRTLFVGFAGGYHGDTFGAMAVSRDPVFFGRFESLLFRAEILPLLPVRLDEFLSRRGGEVAAVILEPLVQGAGGMRMHSRETLRAIFEVTRKHGILFIADEVMTGGGRTGWLWAYQAAGIAPDLICAAKTLAGGLLPLAATLVAPHLVAAFQTSDRTRTFFHGHSFTAHPLACAVAVANWKLLTGQPLEAPRRIEAFWHEALAPLKQHKLVREVRIRGIIAAVEINAPGGYLADIGGQLRRRCLEEGVLLRPLGSVLYALPPYCTSQGSLLQIAQAMIAAIRFLQKG